MTYTTYEKTQYSDYKEDEVRDLYSYTEPPKKLPSNLPKPDFMPSYLVRTSDMKLVEASKVQEGYCTLSYSWSQSGEVIKNEKTGKSHRIDNGKHEIIFPGTPIQENSEREEQTLGEVKYVKFEGLIQEICKDFNIKYIWYDQMCIDQEDEKKKHAEIHQMHKIYSNAYCTIALIPELMVEAQGQGSRVAWFIATMTYDRVFQEAQWMKRMWTLEETLLSSKILFVGRNAHCWWYRLKEEYFPVFRKKTGNDVATILNYAHARTTTNKHDHVFALANVFPEIMEQIKLSYKQNVQELILQFYGLLAKKDLSILFFGPYGSYENMFEPSINNSIKNNDTNKTEYNLPVPIKEFDLPSWTGVYGEHFHDTGYKTSFRNYTVIGRTLRITCRGLTNEQHCKQISGLESFGDIIPPFPEQNLNGDRSWVLVILVPTPSSTKEKLIGVARTTKRMLNSNDYKGIALALQTISHFVSIKNKKLQWISKTSKLETTWFDFQRLVETPQYTHQYVLLTGVRFINPDIELYTHYPIIKKDGDYYKAIGMCRIEHDDYLFNDLTLEEQAFEIH
ncbi:hypothetical protein INT45_006868 [Circinella minor]|uniref:Heterokaryon incompatibility domain-containing protein n=1 Tax=Circinella minor TaxID=1195481 RepID=A0A8H7VG73_9FUNG|nr:hypothetical protein INT45_006868 [Circinella minor]